MRTSQNTAENPSTQSESTSARNTFHLVGLDNRGCDWIDLQQMVTRHQPWAPAHNISRWPDRKWKTCFRGRTLSQRQLAGAWSRCCV